MSDRSLAISEKGLPAERWPEVKTILADALERPVGTERDRFVESACAGDPALRSEVESLLAQPADWPEDGAEGLLRAADAGWESATQSGRRVGAFVLERELGRGGMGAVWLARRADGRWEHRVALKLLKRGTDTEEVLRRFREERQILARLEHPNIARLLDGGETDDGLPYLVMEYVEGTSVTAFARAQRLGLEPRIVLFRKICAAVEFAHQTLVIHRDLKPGNILVTAAGEPKLLDFGVAKLLDPEEAADVTIAERRRYTPAYASPEQVHGELMTTGSDVYSLGALLYELLVGQSPHRFSGPYPPTEEIARVVVENAPVRPSLAVGPEAGRALRGDLDTIILFALAKEPRRRYPDVRAFADDLRRYLEGRPVRARTDTWGYRAGKFVGRNKLTVVAAFLVVLALLGGTVATAWQARRAERRFQDVRRLANAFLFEFHDAIAALSGATPARRLIVARGLEYLDDLAGEAGSDAVLQLELAAAYLKVGDVQGKPYTPNLGDSAGALRSYEKAAALAAPLTDASGGPQQNTARRLFCQACASLGDLQIRAASLVAAAASHQRALELSRRALREAPDRAAEWQPFVANSLIGLGDAIQAGNHRLEDLGRFRASLGHYREALKHCEALAAGQPAASEDARRLTSVCARVARILAEIGRKASDPAAFRECFVFHDRTIGLLEAALRAAPENARFRRSLGDSLVSRAHARLLAREDLPAALVDSRRALEIHAALATADPSNAEAQQDLSFAIYHTGRVLQTQNQFPAAAAAYRRCLEILAPLVAAHPENAETALDRQRARQGLAETENAGTGD